MGNWLDGLIDARLGDAYGIGVLGIVREGRTRLMPDPEERVLAGDTLLLRGTTEDLAGTAADPESTFGRAVHGSQLLPTSAVAILMAPVALAIAGDMGLSPRALLMTVALAASASFMSPVAPPANVFIMGPGGYRFRDDAKVGLPPTIVCLIVVQLVPPLIWPLEG